MQKISCSKSNMLWKETEIYGIWSKFPRWSIPAKRLWAQPSLWLSTDKLVISCATVLPEKLERAKLTRTYFSGKNSTILRIKHILDESETCFKLLNSLPARRKDNVNSKCLRMCQMCLMSYFCCQALICKNDNFSKISVALVKSNAWAKKNKILRI